MTHQEIREKFRKFMEAKGHLWVASSSLLPDDPSVLFTTAGMQQFKPYYTAPELAPAKNVASIQKCVRTSDIDEVGDESHLTFFEMLGNFSFGGYGKKEAIQYAYDFITKEMGLKIDYVTVFRGKGGIPEDVESNNIWRSIDPMLNIQPQGADNFWGPTGNEGPCGPTTEIYVDGIEIWNIVFNEYYQHPKPSGPEKFFQEIPRLEKLKTLGIDTGMGLERLAMVAQKVPTVFETDLFSKLIKKLEEQVKKISYAPYEEEPKRYRIFTDHLRASVFLISDGVIPSNKDRGYILRRLLRRIMTESAAEVYFRELIEILVPMYKNYYPELSNTHISEVYTDEFGKFQKARDRAKKEIQKRYSHGAPNSIVVDGKEAFWFWETFGLPLDAYLDLISGNPILKISSTVKQEFDEKFKEHQEKSRTASAGMFKGGLAGTSDVEVRYHTATHLLNAALHKVLGDDVVQRGSNINAERTRFDFSHPAKMTDEEKTKVEELVNGWIRRDLSVAREEMPLQEARELGAIGAFGEKYGDTVSVYTVSDPETGEVISREFCGGPHVTHTGEIGTFKITKEESASAGVRRIRATIS